MTAQAAYLLAGVSNHEKKVFPNEFSDGIEGAVFHPVRVNIV